MLWLAACRGPESPATLVEWCSSREPTLLLALGPDQHPARDPLHAVRRAGDRLVYFVENWEPGAEWPGSGEILSREVHSSGPCGEEPARIASDVDFLFDPRHAFAGEPVLACRRDGGDVLLIDPSGEASPRVLVEDSGCAVLPFRDGLVAVVTTDADDEVGQLVYLPSIVEPAAVLRVVREDVHTPLTDTGFLYADPRRLAVGAADVVVLTIDGEIVAIDPVGGDEKLVVADAAGFEASEDGRFVLWQPGPPVLAGEVWDARPTFLTDRNTGDEIDLGSARFGLGTAGIQPGLARATDDFSTEPTRVVLLPSLEQLEFDSSRFVNGRHVETASVLWTESGEDGPGRLHLLDPATGDSTRLFDQPGFWTWEDGRFLLLEGVAENDYTLWERRLDEDEPTRVAEHTFQPFFVTEHKIATVAVEGDDRLGALEIHDVRTDRRERLAARVDAFAARLNWLRALDDAFAWAVSDGEQSGIWGARLAD